MSDTPPPPAPEPASAEPPAPERADVAGAAEAARRHRRKRLVGLVVVVAFVGGGFLLFGPRVPREVTLRFDLPPTIRDGSVSFDRGEVSIVAATLSDEAGARIASITLPSPGGQVGPRTSAAVVSLKPGRYGVRARVQSFAGRKAELDGVLEVDGPEAIVNLD